MKTPLLTHASVLLLSLLTLVAAPGCSDDDSPAAADFYEIRFNAVSPRARIDDGLERTNADVTTFVVTAFAAEGTVMDGATVLRTSEGWTYSPAVYWSAVRTEPVEFYAIAPDAGVGRLQHGGEGCVVSGYENMGTLALSCATASERGYIADNDESPRPVNLEFREVLARVAFRLTSTTDDSSPRVTALRVRGISRTGDFHLPPAGTDITAGHWENLTSPTPTDLYLSTDSEGTVLTSTPVEFSNCGYRYAIPQPLSDAALDVETSGGAVTSVPLTTPAASVWEMDKTYVYTLTFTPSPVLSLEIIE